MLGAVVAAWGVVVGTLPFNDNSFFTHLATGRIILDDGSVPSSDPYSFTAAGADWVVQSWFASLLYAVAEELAGPVGIRALMTLLTVAVCLLLWSLSAHARSLLARFGVVVVALLVSAGALSERPLLFGLIGFLLTMLVGERRLDPRWLLPICWIWVNTHGSFPLGLAYLAALVLGRRLDRTADRADVEAIGWFVAGVVAGAASPVGPRLLTFPVELLSDREALEGVQEWMAPTFDDVPSLSALVLLLVAILALTRRPSFARALPLGIFAAAALVGSRNLSLLSFVAVLVVAEGLGDLGSIEATARSAVARPAAVAIGALILIIATSRLQAPHYEFAAYPVGALAAVDEAGSGDRMIAREAVGNLQELLVGAKADVFTDDRFDMYPAQVLIDARELLAGDAGWEAIVDRYDASTIVWETSEPLAAILLADPDWRITYVDEVWLVAERR